MLCKAAASKHGAGAGSAHVGACAAAVGVLLLRLLLGCCGICAWVHLQQDSDMTNLLHILKWSIPCLCMRCIVWWIGVPHLQQRVAAIGRGAFGQAIRCGQRGVG